MFLKDEINFWNSHANNPADGIKWLAVKKRKKIIKILDNKVIS